MAVRLPGECGIVDDDTLNIDDGSLFMRTYVLRVPKPLPCAETSSSAQMKKVFDPCINRTLELVDGQVAAVMKAGHGKPKVGAYTDLNSSSTPESKSDSG